MAYINNKIVFLLFVNVLLLLIGMLLDASPALLLAPLYSRPVAKTLGIDAIHFGVMVCFNLMVGTLTPPVGMMLFIVSNVGKVKLSVMYKGNPAVCGRSSGRSAADNLCPVAYDVASRSAYAVKAAEREKQNAEKDSYCKTQVFKIQPHRIQDAP